MPGTAGKQRLPPLAPVSADRSPAVASQVQSSKMAENRLADDWFRSTTIIERRPLARDHFREHQLTGCGADVDT
jgi:hypothetical protein